MSKMYKWINEKCLNECFTSGCSNTGMAPEPSYELQKNSKKQLPPQHISKEREQFNTLTL